VSYNYLPISFLFLCFTNHAFQRSLGILSNAGLVKYRDDIGIEFHYTCNSIEKNSKRLYLMLEML
jgi:ABC-type metal ion transport system substrate-binding protein